jgi:hypothetical protein
MIALTCWSIIHVLHVKLINIITNLRHYCKICLHEVYITVARVGYGYEHITCLDYGLAHLFGFGYWLKHVAELSHGLEI